MILRKISRKSGLISKRWFDKNIGSEMKKFFFWIVQEGGRERDARGGNFKQHKQQKDIRQRWGGKDHDSMS